MDNYLNERQRQILDMLVAQKEIKLSYLKEQFDVTEMTLRRDLEKLEQSGHLRRIFGGAILVESDIALRDRLGVMTQEKEKIGKEAASLILPGESVFIDAGTTPLQVARFMRAEYRNTVVTNSLNIVSELQNKGISTIVIGGNVLDTTNSLVGPIAVNTLSTMVYDRVFLGATGLTVNHGFSNSNIHETEVKKIAIQQTGDVNILIDHTKFDMKGLTSFATLGQVNRIISDQSPSQSLIEGCKENNVEIIVVS